MSTSTRYRDSDSPNEEAYHGPGAVGSLTPLTLRAYNCRNSTETRHLDPVTEMSSTRHPVAIDVLTLAQGGDVRSVVVPQSPCLKGDRNSSSTRRRYEKANRRVTFRRATAIKRGPANGLRWQRSLDSKRTLDHLSTRIQPNSKDAENPSAHRFVQIAVHPLAITLA